LGGEQSSWASTNILDKNKKVLGQIYTNSVTKQKVTVKNVEAIKFYDMAALDLSHSSVDLVA
jgi:hypothetical protein